MSKKEGILDRMKKGEFSVSVQLDPPRTDNVGDFKESLTKLKKAGVSLVDINSSKRISHDSIQLSVAPRNYQRQLN
jgi:5,10-methylenetetrahydrofolate reductase